MVVTARTVTDRSQRSSVAMGQGCTGALALANILRSHEPPRPFFSRVAVPHLFGRRHRLHA